MIPNKIARLYEDIRYNRSRPLHTRALDDTVRDCFIAYNAFGGYCIPHSVIKSGPAQAIMAGSVWEPGLLGFIAGSANGDVIHAGAFFGDGLPMLDKCIAPNTLWAFEPSDMYYYADLTRLISKLNHTNLYHKSLGDKTLGYETTIDHMIPWNRKIGVIHLDIEGDEQKALDGAKRTIERCKPILVVEEVFNKVETPPGYRRDISFGRNTVLVPC